MPKIHTTFGRLLDGKQNNRLATTYQDKTSSYYEIVVPKLTQLGYIENRVIERLQTNDSTYIVRNST
jgi:hypothetical protein